MNANANSTNGWDDANPPTACHVITLNPHRRHSNMIQYVRTDFINGKPDGCQTHCLIQWKSVEAKLSHCCSLRYIHTAIVGSKYICNASHPTVNCIIGLIQLHLMHFMKLAPPLPYQVLEESETLYLRRRSWVWVWIGICEYIAHCCQPFQMGEDTVTMPAVDFLTCIHICLDVYIIQINNYKNT